MTPFQCEECHFRNIYKRVSDGSDLRDCEVLEIMRQATTDSLWSREPTTVRANLQEAKRGQRSARRFGLPDQSATPPMDPFPVSDDFGMKAALLVLDRSLDPGRYSGYVQWATFRKARSTITNICQTGSSGLEDVVGAYEKNRCWISKVPTHTFWFHRFMVGIHKRVGEIRRQDEALTIDVLHEVDRILEANWKRAQDGRTQRRVAEMGVWFLGGFCTGLRGEEMVRIEFAGTAKSAEKWVTKPTDPYFMFVVGGRSKGNQLSGAKFSVPCVGATQGTHLRPGRWVERLTSLMRAEGVKTGRLLQQKLNSPRMCKWEGGFMAVLEQVQATTDLIDKELDVRDGYGLGRTTWRGATAHARNMEVDKGFIKAVNRSMKDDKGAARLDMIALYSESEALTPTYLRYSRAF
jgi:hypothetical protein